MKSLINRVQGRSIKSPFSTGWLTAAHSTLRIAAVIGLFAWGTERSAWADALNWAPDAEFSPQEDAAAVELNGVPEEIAQVEVQGWWNPDLSEFSIESAPAEDLSIQPEPQSTEEVALEPELSNFNVAEEEPVQQEAEPIQEQGEILQEIEGCESCDVNLEPPPPAETPAPADDQIAGPIVPSLCGPAPDADLSIMLEHFPSNLEADYGFSEKKLLRAWGEDEAGLVGTWTIKGSNKKADPVREFNLEMTQIWICDLPTLTWLRDEETVTGSTNGAAFQFGEIFASSDGNQIDYHLLYFNGNPDIKFGTTNHSIVASQSINEGRSQEAIWFEQLHVRTWAGPHRMDQWTSAADTNKLSSATWDFFSDGTLKKLAVLHKEEDFKGTTKAYQHTGPGTWAIVDSVFLYNNHVEAREVGQDSAISDTLRYGERNSKDVVTFELRESDYRGFFDPSGDLQKEERSAATFVHGSMSESFKFEVYYDKPVAPQVSPNPSFVSAAFEKAGDPPQSGSIVFKIDSQGNPIAYENLPKPDYSVLGKVTAGLSGYNLNFGPGLPAL